MRLEIVATRNVTLGDIAAAARLLGRPLLRRAEGGIDFSDNPRIHRDVRFYGGSQLDVDMSVGCDTGTYVLPPETVVFDVANCTLIDERRIAVKFRAHDTQPFADPTGIMETIATAFGATPSAIVNRGAVGTGPGYPLETDSKRDTDDYWGFDVAAAIEKYTVPSDRWPDAPEERLFECWRCSALLPAWHYPGEYGKRDDGYTGANRVASTLARLVVGGTATACENCAIDATTRPVGTPRKRKELADGPDHGGPSFKHVRHNASGGHSGRWMFELQVMVTGHPIKCSTFHHIGYITKLFPTKQAAADEYHAAYPHMRPIRKESEWTSDWDPVTRLRFVVRRVDNVERTIECPW